MDSFDIFLLVLTFLVVLFLFIYLALDWTLSRDADSEHHTRFYRYDDYDEDV